MLPLWRRRRRVIPSVVEDSVWEGGAPIVPDSSQKGVKSGSMAAALQILALSGNTYCGAGLIAASIPHAACLAAPPE